MVHGQNTDNDRWRFWIDGGNLEPPNTFPNDGMERLERRIFHPTHPFKLLKDNQYFTPVRVLSV